MLADQNTGGIISRALKDYMDHNDNGEVSLSDLWEIAKAVRKEKFTEIYSRLQRAHTQKQHDLAGYRKRLEQQHKHNGSSNTPRELNQYRKSPDHLLTHKAAGALRFSSQ